MSRYNFNSPSNVASDYNFLLEIFEVLEKHKVITENVLRVIRIRSEYRKLIAEGNTGKAALEIIADKNYVSTKCVEAILYNRKKQKSNKM